MPSNLFNTLLQAQCTKIKTKKRANKNQLVNPTEAEEEEAMNEYGAALLELPPGLKALRPVFFGLMAFIGVCVVLSIALMIVARKRYLLSITIECTMSVF